MKTIEYQVGLGNKNNYFSLTSTSGYPILYTLPHESDKYIFKNTLTSYLGGEIDSFYESIKIKNRRDTPKTTKIVSSSTNIIGTDIYTEDGEPLYFKIVNKIRNAFSIYVDEELITVADRNFIYTNNEFPSAVKYYDKSNNLIAEDNYPEVFRIFILKDYIHLEPIYNLDNKVIKYKVEGNSLLLTFNRPNISIRELDPEDHLLKIYKTKGTIVSKDSIHYWPFFARRQLEDKILYEYDYSEIMPNIINVQNYHSDILDDYTINVPFSNMISSSIKSIKIYNRLNDELVLDISKTTDIQRSFNHYYNFINLFSVMKSEGISGLPSSYYAVFSLKYVSYKNYFTLFDYEKNGIVPFNESVFPSYESVLSFSPTREGNEQRNCKVFNITFNENQVIYNQFIGSFEETAGTTFDNLIKDSEGNVIFVTGYSEGGYSAYGYGGQSKDAPEVIGSTKPIQPINIENKFLVSPTFVQKIKLENLSTVNNEHRSYLSKQEYTPILYDHVHPELVRMGNFPLFYFGIENDASKFELIPNYVMKELEQYTDFYLEKISNKELLLDLSRIGELIDGDTGQIKNEFVLSSTDDSYAFDYISSFSNYIDANALSNSLDVENILLYGILKDNQSIEEIDTGSYTKLVNSLKTKMFFKFIDEPTQYDKLLVRFVGETNSVDNKYMVSYA